MDVEKLNYRRSTLGLIITEDNLVVIVNKQSYKPNVEWSFPGGGIEESENPREALLRELKEELSVDNFIIIHESASKYKYEWSDTVIQQQFIKNGIYYRGQELSQFVVKYLGNNEDFVAGDGIRQIKLVKFDDLKKYLIFPNQFENAALLFSEYKQQLK